MNEKRCVYNPHGVECSAFIEYRLIEKHTGKEHFCCARHKNDYDALNDRYGYEYFTIVPYKQTKDERIADLQAKLEEKESYICNFEHATKIERADNEAELQRLRTENSDLREQYKLVFEQGKNLKAENVALKRPVTISEWGDAGRNAPPRDNGFDRCNRIIASRSQQAPATPEEKPLE